MIPHVPPPFAPGRLRGAFARGAAYERAVGKWLGPLVLNLGWDFYDHPWLLSRGKYCQPDFVLQAPSGACIVVECKLTWVDCALQQEKYRVALAPLPVTSMMMVRRVVPATPPLVSLWDVVDGGVVLWVN